MGVGDEDGAVPPEARRVQGCDRRCCRAWRGKAAQQIVEPRNFGHRISPALTDGWGIAASHESFVAWIRRCDESAAFTLSDLYCVAQVPEEAAERRKTGQCDRFFQV